MAFSVRPGGPAHLRSAPLASGAAARGDVLPARGPLPPATGRYGPRGVFTHQAGVRCTWGDVPPARGPPPSATGRYGPRGVVTHRAGARCAWGDVPPGSRPASTCHRALRLAWSLHPSKLVLASLGGTSPPARGPHLLATGRYGPRGVSTHQAGRSAPPTAARPRSLSLVVVTRRSRLATSRDYPRERPLPVTLSSRWTSRREEEGGGT